MNHLHQCHSQTKEKKSVVWDEFDVVTGSDKTGVIGAKCSHCKNILAYKRGGATSHLKRHLKVCVPRRVAESGNKKVPSKLCCHLRLQEDQGKLCYQPINMTKTKLESFLLRCLLCKVPFQDGGASVICVILLKSQPK